MTKASSGEMRAMLPGPCSRDWPMSLSTAQRGTVSVPGQVFIELLWVLVRLGECHAVLADVVTLVQQAPELRDGQLRTVLVALADRAARLLEGEIR